jgi:hypothetical protein
MRYALCAAAAALLCATAAPSMAAGVTVLRGASAAQAAGGNVTILRGSGVVQTAAVPAESRPAATAVAGGSLLWLIDADGQVSACGVRGSGRVGAPDIVHCSAGPVIR